MNNKLRSVVISILVVIIVLSSATALFCYSSKQEVSWSFDIPQFEDATSVHVSIPCEFGIKRYDLPVTINGTAYEGTTISIRVSYFRERVDINGINIKVSPEYICAKEYEITVSEEKIE